MDEASGSSSSHFRWSFDVFLSFRGEDTRSNFTSHLHTALRRTGINVFIDNKLWRGEEIFASLLEAIKESKISIVIISENYATSSWCLNELVEIMMCNKLRGQVVLPIFYKVEPSQVRKQSGTFEQSFAKLQVRFNNNNLQAWRDALTAVSYMSGWVLQNHDEAILIQNIVQVVWKILNHATMQLPVAKYPVGVDRQVVDLLSHVMIDGTRMVGLYGIGGMGKTTLAKALYNRIAHKFEGYCFLANIREASKQYEGLVGLQEKLLCEILMDDFIKVSNLNRGINIIRNRLCSKKILLILDDVDTSEQLQVLAGGHDWFGGGSKIIVTTKDKQLLLSHGFNILESVPKLNYGEALELFSWHTFKTSYPPSDYLRLSIEAANYCNELPLALEVLGSLLYSTDQTKFKRILDECANSNLDKEIQDPLQISYDELEGDVQEIFLFISCFFVGEDITLVRMMLEECGCLCLEKGITKLMNLSLLSINKFNEVEMHDLIQQMGRTVARSRTSTSPSLKRLLVEDEAMYVLNDNKEARAVKAIQLAFPQPTKLDIDSRAFEKVKNLVVLKANKRCEGLKQLDLSYSDFLEEIADLSSAINLEKLSLSGCLNLVNVHESVGSLGKLVELSLSSHFHGFTQFPSLLKLKSLKKMSIDNCTIVEWYPHFSEEMKSSLKDLRFYSSSITELSRTIGYLTSLEHLMIVDCSKLTTLPNTIYCLTNLTSLDVLQSDLSTFPSPHPSWRTSLFPCLTRLNLYENKITNLDFLKSITYDVPSLRELNLSKNKFCRLPSCIVNFKSLRFLETIDCELLEEIPKVPEGIVSMQAEGCKSLAKFPDNLADFISCESEHVDGQFKQLILMNCDIPEWYTYKSMNNSVTFSMPFNLYPGWKLKVFAPCVKFQVNYVDGESLMGFECEVFINDNLVWSSEEVPFREESRRILVKATPHKYMWLIVLYPYRGFHPNCFMGTSLEKDLNQSRFGTNYVDDHDWNYYRRESILRKFTVTFKVPPRAKNSVATIERCGVHVIMEN